MERVLFGGNEPNAHCETTTRTNPENFAVHGGLIGCIPQSSWYQHLLQFVWR